jgi:hypothetical protein
VDPLMSEQPQPMAAEVQPMETHQRQQRRCAVCSRLVDLQHAHGWAERGPICCASCLAEAERRKRRVKAKAERLAELRTTVRSRTMTGNE